MNAKLREHLLSVTLLLCILFLQGCATMPAPVARGDVLSVTGVTARSIVQDAVYGRNFTMVLQKGNWMLFAKPMMGGVGFVNVDISKWRQINLLETGMLKGCFADCHTFRSLVDFLKQNGWQPVTVAPAVFQGLMRMSSSLTTFFLFILVPEDAPLEVRT